MNIICRHTGVILRRRRPNFYHYLTTTPRQQQLSTDNYPNKRDLFYRQMENSVRESTGLPRLPPISSSINVYVKNDHSVKSMVQGVVDLLIKISETNGEIPVDFSNPPIEVILYKKLKISSQHHKLPPFPEEPWNAERLESYLRHLTARDFHSSELSSANINGLVPSLVKDILRITNPLTLHAHSVGAYNTAIAYFIRIRDLKTARGLFHQLLDESEHSPNTDTFNIMLLSARHRLKNHTNQRNERHQHPLLFINSILKIMLETGVPLDSQTWNIILLCTPTPDAKSIVLREMQSRSVPLSRRGLATVIKDVIDISGPEQAMEFLQKQKVYSVTMDCIHLIVARLISNRKINKAWKILDYAYDHWNLYPTTTTLNIILEGLVPRGRLDWMFGAWGGMVNRWSVQPDAISYRHLFEVACKRNFHRQYFTIIELIYAKYCTETRCNSFKSIDPQMEYLIRHCQARATFYRDVVNITDKTLNLSPPTELTPTQQSSWESALTALQWKEIPKLHYKTRTTPSQKTCSVASYLIGFDPVLLNPDRPDHPKHYHRFYGKRYKSKWKRFVNERRETSQHEQHVKDAGRRKSMLHLGPYEHFLNQLKDQGVIM